MQVCYTGGVVDEAGIRTRYQAIVSLVDERARRLFAGAEALAVGYGGVSGVARATGMSRQTVSTGLSEVQAVVAAAPKGRIRREGAGRPRLPETIKRRSSTGPTPRPRRMATPAAAEDALYRAAIATKGPGIGPRGGWALSVSGRHGVRRSPERKTHLDANPPPPRSE